MGKSGSKSKRRVPKKKRRGGGGSGGGGGSSSGGGGGGGGGGGLLTSMRGGFKKAAHAATGTGEKKRPSPAGKIANWVLTIVLIGVAAFLLLRRCGYIE